MHYVPGDESTKERYSSYDGYYIYKFTQKIDGVPVQSQQIARNVREAVRCYLALNPPQEDSVFLVRDNYGVPYTVTVCVRSPPQLAFTLDIRRLGEKQA